MSPPCLGVSVCEAFLLVGKSFAHRDTEARRQIVANACEDERRRRRRWLPFVDEALGAFA